MADSSYIVIKVKFGETLRRFNALVLDEELVSDMAMLREKIRSLFGFATDADFTLTYIDEDGDIVALVDEDDLRDVVNQSLNPLRITVSLDNNKLTDQLPSQGFSYGAGSRIMIRKNPLDFAAFHETFKHAMTTKRVIIACGKTPSNGGLDAETDKKKKDFRMESPAAGVEWKSSSSFRWEQLILSAMNECPFSGICP